MEVGQHGADYAELKARINEDASFARAWTDSPRRVLRSRVLQRSYSGRPNCHDPAALFQGPVDLCGYRFRDMKALTMHLVIFHVLRADGLKGSQADMQGDLRNLYSALANAC